MYIHTYIHSRLVGHVAWKSASIGATDGTPPYIGTSEVTVDLRWHFPTEVQRPFPADLYKGLSLSQWMLAGRVQWTMDCQWHVPTRLQFFDIWRVI